MGFPFVTALSSLPGNTLHSNRNLIVNPGIVGEPVMPLALLAFSAMHGYHMSLDRDNKQRPLSDLADIFVLTRPPSLTEDLLCPSMPRGDLKSATSGQMAAGLPWTGLMCQRCFMQRGQTTTVCPANPKGIVPNTSQRWFLFCSCVPPECSAATGLNRRFDLPRLLKCRLSASPSTFPGGARVAADWGGGVFSSEMNKIHILFEMFFFIRSSKFSCSHTFLCVLLCHESSITLFG